MFVEGWCLNHCPVEVVTLLYIKSVRNCFCRYRGGVDVDGRPVMVVVGAHFLLRCLDLERFVLYVVKVWFLILMRCSLL